MHRCLGLAMLGGGNVSPNPMVGAVLVHRNRIIGEGYHRYFGGPHAEVNCINSVSEANRPFIRESTLYVSIEPCNHHGKTPPCSDLIIRHGIPAVVVACKDPFAAVNGAGLLKLQQAGIHVITGVLEKEAMDLNRRFFTFHQQHRPYIILKWAQSQNKKIAAGDGSPVKISDPLTDRLVHRWRTEEAAIIVGTNTVLKDNPALTARWWPGKHPWRIMIDRHLKIPAGSRLLDNTAPTIILNQVIQKQEGNLTYHQYDTDRPVITETCTLLYREGLLSLIVEGGAVLLQSFIDAGLWDEARIITNNQLNIVNGGNAPELSGAVCIHTEYLRNDEISYFRRAPFR